LFKDKALIESSVEDDAEAERIRNKATQDMMQIDLASMMMVIAGAAMAGEGGESAGGDPCNAQ